MASIVREAFAGRMAAASAGQGGGQPNPVELIRALRGGRGGRSDADVKSEEAKMTITVDNRSNSLIVTAPEPLFEQVRGTGRPDRSGQAPTWTNHLHIVSLKKSNPETVQRALAAIMGTTSPHSPTRIVVRPASDKVSNPACRSAQQRKVVAGCRSCNGTGHGRYAGWHGRYAGRYGRNGWTTGGMGGMPGGMGGFGGQRGGMGGNRGGHARRNAAGRCGGAAQAAAADRKRPGRLARKRAQWPTGVRRGWGVASRCRLLPARNPVRESYSGFRRILSELDVATTGSIYRAPSGTARFDSFLRRLSDVVASEITGFVGRRAVVPDVRVQCRGSRSAWSRARSAAGGPGGPPPGGPGGGGFGFGGPGGMGMGGMGWS